MTANEELLDRSIRHAVGLQRYSAGVVRKIIAQLNRVDEDLVAKLLKHDPTAVSGSYSRKRLEKLLEAVRDVNTEAYATLRKDLNSELRALATHEANFQRQIVNASVPVNLDIVKPSSAQLYAAVQARPFQGRHLRDWYRGLEQAARARIREAIRLGFIEGETIDQIVRRVRGTRARRFKDGVLEINRRSAQTVVRTAVNHTANVARSEVYRANEGVIKGVRWVSTLDTRTSMICISRDGKVFPIDGGPRPPAHPNCRSSTAPVLKSWKEMGINLREAPEGTRASMDGQVPASMTYAEWLKKQPTKVQDEALGPSKGALFRSGKMPVDRFVDQRGRELTLDQLKKVDQGAFEKAGLLNPVKPPPGVPRDEVARFLRSPKQQRSLLERLVDRFPDQLKFVRSVKKRERWKIPDNPLVAIRHYTSPAFLGINRRMREGVSRLEDRQFTALAGNGVDKLPSPPRNIWRAPRRQTAAADALWSTAKVGDDFDLGDQLQSFSTEKSVAESWSRGSRLLLHVEKPRRGAYIAPVSHFENEKEVLLPAGLRYRVADKRTEKRDGGDLRIIVLEIVDE